MSTAQRGSEATAAFEDRTLQALQLICEALLKLETGMLSLADAIGGSVKERVYRDYVIHPQRRALKKLDARIWPPSSERTP